MNYQQIYDDLIKSRSGQPLLKNEYYENHHIIPKSLGGSDDDNNLIKLTAREHFIAHWLLYKIHNNRDLAFAWNMMSITESNNHKGRKRQTARKYEYARKAFSKYSSELHKGRKLTKEHKQKLSESKMGVLNPMYGKKHTDEFKQYLSEINIGEKNGFYGKTHTKESRKIMSLAAKKRVGEKSNVFGYHHTEENKQKLSEMYKGKPRVKPHEIVKCPHCDKEGIKPNMIRWHFDNCKHK